MSNCIYCGKSAGIFSKSHKECVQINTEGKEQISQEINAYFQSENYLNIDKNIGIIANESFVNSYDCRKLIVKGYDNAVNKFLEDGILSETELNSLDKFDDIFNITDEELSEYETQTKIIKNRVLQDVLNNDIQKSRLTIQGQLPFLLEKDEIVLWIFQNAELYELVTRTQFIGGSHGVSVKIAKGLYYRTSSFRGEPFKTQETKFTSSGLLALTNKNLYFGSTTKTLKIKYSQIISMPTFSDAIGIQQSRANAKPLYFKNIDVWFVFNVISNLNGN
jgi:hypothetical protein